jgi:hypothetical protein
MTEDVPGKPPAPDLPKYLREPLEKQSPERLEAVATYAGELAEWKRRQRQEELQRRRAEEAVDEEELEELDDREISTDPADYEDVPASGAYITVKTTKQTDKKEYRYYYWQWRKGDSWKNEYIAPAKPQE